MIRMSVGEQHRVDPPDAVRQQLGPQVWPRIYEKCCTINSLDNDA